MGEYDIRLNVNLFGVAFYATQFTHLSVLLTLPYRRIGRICRNSMKSFARKVQRFLISEDGPTAVEYAVMLALIIVVCLTAVTAIGQNAASTFDTVAKKI